VISSDKTIFDEGIKLIEHAATLAQTELEIYALLGVVTKCKEKVYDVSAGYLVFVKHLRVILLLYDNTIYLCVAPFVSHYIAEMCIGRSGYERDVR
jgi:hypothetical protein